MDFLALSVRASPGASNTLGVMFVYAGRDEQAIDYFRDAEALEPRGVVLTANLTESRAIAARKAEALALAGDFAADLGVVDPVFAAYRRPPRALHLLKCIGAPD